MTLLAVMLKIKLVKENKLLVYLKLELKTYLRLLFKYNLVSSNRLHEFYVFHSTPNHSILKDY